MWVNAKPTLITWHYWLTRHSTYFTLHCSQTSNRKIKSNTAISSFKDHADEQKISKAIWFKWYCYIRMYTSSDSMQWCLHMYHPQLGYSYCILSFLAWHTKSEECSDLVVLISATGSLARLTKRTASIQSDLCCKEMNYQIDLWCIHSVIHVSETFTSCTNYSLLTVLIVFDRVVKATRIQKTGFIHKYSGLLHPLLSSVNFSVEFPNKFMRHVHVAPISLCLQRISFAVDILTKQITFFRFGRGHTEWS